MRLCLFSLLLATFVLTGCIDNSSSDFESDSDNDEQATTFSINVEHSVKSYAKGKIVSCYDSHNGPSGD